MIGAAEALRRLLDAGLLAAGDVVDGDVAVRYLARSNAVYRVEAGGRDLVCKSGLVERPADQGSSAAEHALYRAVAGSPPVQALGLTPALVADLGDLLVLARVAPGETLEARLRVTDTPGPDAAQLGRTLGLWHRHAAGLASVGSAAAPAVGSPLRLPGQLPWAFSALAPTAPSFVGQHEQMRALRERLRDDRALVDGLARLAARWRPTALIHGDVRWDNALVAGEGAAARVVLVDWEFVDVGDPAWDLAGALAEPAALAVLAEDAGDPAGLATAVAAYAAGLAAGYQQARAEPGAVDDLRRGADLAAARLVQIAFQHAAWDVGGGVDTGLCLGRMASRMLASPDALRAVVTPTPVAGR